MLKELIRKYSLKTYFILSILISWGSLLLILGPQRFLGLEKIPDTLLPFTYLAMISGTTISGLLLIGLVKGRSGFKDFFSRLKKWKMPFKFYAIAIFTAPIIFLITSLVLSIFSKEFIPSIIISNQKLVLIMSSIAGGLMAGFFEEIGWTGFAIPKLRETYSLIKTGLIVGIVWGIWHMPLFLSPITGSVSLFVLLLLIKLITHLPAYRVIMTLMYDKTNSLLLTIIMHISLTTGMLVFQPTILEGVNIIWYNLFVTAMIWIFYFLINSYLKKHQIRKSSG